MDIYKELDGLIEYVDECMKLDDRFNAPYQFRYIRDRLVSISSTESPQRAESDPKHHSNLYTHAEFELERIGMLDSRDLYEGMLGRGVLDLIQVFSEQGHSGFSGWATIDLFKRLANFEALTAVSDDPDEWEDRSGYSNENPLWQNKRNSKIFSRDCGKTYYDIDDSDKREYDSAPMRKK